MIRFKAAAPAIIVLVGYFALAFCLLVVLPLMANPLGYPPEIARRLSRDAAVLSLGGSAMLLGGGLSGVRRRRAAGRSRTSAASVAFSGAAAVGALVMITALYLIVANP